MTKWLKTCLTLGLLSFVSSVHTFSFYSYFPRFYFSSARCLSWFFYSDWLCSVPSLWAFRSQKSWLARRHVVTHRAFKFFWKRWIMAFHAAFQNIRAPRSCGCLSDCHRGSNLSSARMYIERGRGRGGDQKVERFSRLGAVVKLLFDAFCNSCLSKVFLPQWMRRFATGIITSECFWRCYRRYTRAKDSSFQSHNGWCLIDACVTGCLSWIDGESEHSWENKLLFELLVAKSAKSAICS